MNLHELSPAPGSKRASVRVGRGLGSGLGKTSGKGQNVLVLKVVKNLCICVCLNVDSIIDLA